MDISLLVSDRVFNYRVAGLIKSQNHILLHRIATETYWSMPGGRVQAGETARTALSRELQEEIGIQARIGALLLCVENFFPYGEHVIHEICLFFAVEDLPMQSPGPIPSSEGNLEFRWVAKDELKCYEVRPQAILESLLNNQDPCAFLTIGREYANL